MRLSAVSPVCRAGAHFIYVFRTKQRRTLATANTLSFFPTGFWRRPIYGEYKWPCVYNQNWHYDFSR
jgi:hypothetical protein